jgi:hypothetical protein
VALHLAADVPGLLSQARYIVSRMTGNANFPSPSPSMAAVNKAITNLDQAQTVAATRVLGSVATRNSRRAALVTLLYGLKGYVQSVVDSVEADHAPAIIESAGMSIAKSRVRSPQRFGASSGDLSGSVVVRAKVAGRRVAYEWQASGDGGATWRSLRVTMQAKTTVDGLQPGSTWLFRFRSVTSGGESDWSDSVSIIVR